MLIAPFWREMLSFSREKDSVHSGISLQKGPIIIHYGFNRTVEDGHRREG